MTRRQPEVQVLAAFLLLLGSGCSSPEGPPADAEVDGDVDGDGDTGGDADVDADGDTDGDVDADVDEPGGPCSVGERACADTEHERICEAVGGEGRWMDRACEAHHYCVTDRCEPACLDECALGATRSTEAGAQTCRLYSDGAGTFVEPGVGMHDLSRLHDGWMREHQLANGYVCETLFTDTSYTTPTAYLGTVDSAEWTGTYLAAEALRLLATRSPDAERQVEALVERLHQLFDITGTPGHLARIWAPLDGDPLLADLYHEEDFSHHRTTYGGGEAFWHGWTSRDMYQGVLLGLGLAYDALSSEAHRELIRDEVVALAMALIERRDDVPVRVRYHAFGSWLEQDLTYDLQHMVVLPTELVDGRVFIQVGSDEDPTDYGASELVGVIEFLPNFTDILGQTPAVGGLLPAIPRPGSAIMLASALRLAIHVTEGVPGYAAEHDAVAAHYRDNVESWLAVMAQHTYHHAERCWTQYFGLTIAFHPLYNLIRLEPDPVLRQAFQERVLGARMWPRVEGHHNAYFAYIAASQGLAGLVSTDRLGEVGRQLGQFVPPPKARGLVDNTGVYPTDPDCPNQTATPTDVGDRVPTDFIWQHHPFELATPEPEPRLVFASADYLVAYWLGRHHGFLEDDAPNTCLRWAGP